MELVHLDATNLYVIETSTIQGINASALVHEVHSYSSSKSGLDQFFWKVLGFLMKMGC